MQKKIKNHNINFSHAGSLDQIRRIAALAKESKIESLCIAVNAKTAKDLKAYRGCAKLSAEAFKISIVIGLEYYTNSAKFIIFGDDAISFLVQKNHSESFLMEAKVLHNCTVILSSVSEIDLDSLNCSFNIRLIDAYIKYMNNVDELKDHDTQILKQNLLWNSTPLAGSQNCSDSYSIFKKKIGSSKDIVSYILERRPVSIFSKLMIS